MKRNIVWTALVAVALLVPANVGASSISYDADLVPPGYYNGSGNPNGGFTIANDNGVENGLRAKLRQDPNVIHTPDNVYHVPAGAQPGVPTRAAWNYEFSINLCPSGSACGLTLNDLIGFSTFTLEDMTDGASSTVGFPYWSDDATWGPSGEEAMSLTNILVNWGAQNSENGTFADNPLNLVPGYTFDMDDEHYYRFSMNLGTANGSLVSNSIDIAVGAATNPEVPEPATLTMLGLGLAGFGWRQRKRNRAVA